MVVSGDSQYYYLCGKGESSPAREEDDEMNELGVDAEEPACFTLEILPLLCTRDLKTN